MKSLSSVIAAALALPMALQLTLRAAESLSPFVYESPHEFFGAADFNGDGRPDLVIVDKESGKYRLGYQTAAGAFSWVDCRPSGVKGVGGFSLGKLLATNLDALALASPDANQIAVIEASSPIAPGKPLVIPFTAALGPSTLIAADSGSLAKTGLLDLYVASIYNSPDANLATLLRNDGATYPKLMEATLPGAAVHGNRLALKPGGPELACAVVGEEKGDTLKAERLSGGAPELVVSAAGLPAGSDYAVGDFGGAARQFLVYKPGQSSLSVRPVEESAPGRWQFGPGSSFDLGQPILRTIVFTQGASQKLFVIFGKGEKAGVFDFDGAKAPTLVQTFPATNDWFTFAFGLADAFVAFLQPANGKFTTRYQVFNATGKGYAPGQFGGLPSLADNDNMTIPDIYSRIAANQTVAREADMKPYTDNIPGTEVTFAMVPIPGGEFVMGSPDSEPSRNPDEGPQHKVKISPFWMGQYEITWNEYELFMYPDEEKRSRGTIPTDSAGDKLADAVTHPSKPYVEMSFGMGKDGYPAISMTQHAANKYCQWLSAKTGQFYRLPTEAEWEYACRAGTTTAYFFGDDASQLGQYAWYEQNSDFKYQKVGKKKANPWGLYDIYGNVTEWVLDQYDPDYYQRAGTSALVDPWDKATKPYPHSVRGGSWDDEATRCRSAARRGSDRSWKMQDPQLPKSIWYFSDAQWVGFRIVRPLQTPPPEQMQKYWTSGVERD